MKLAELQRQFADALVLRAPSEEASTIATGNDRLAPLEQLEIYREQFWWRHIGCLAEDFPTLKALVGDDAFGELCARYLAAYPPKGFLLRDLGKDLAAFAATEGDRLLVDMASIEWAFVDAFDAPDAPKLDPKAIEGVPEDAWPNARLSLHPSIVLLELEHPVDELRAAHRKGEPIARVAPSPRTLAVYRRELLLYVEPLDRSAFSVLSAITKGETLAAACSGAADAEEKLAEWFARWAALGWISRVDV